MDYKKISSFILQTFSVIPLVVLFMGVIWQIFSRYILAVPSKYSEELIRFALVFLTFLAGSYCFVIRRHISLDFIENKNLRANSTCLEQNIRPGRDARKFWLKIMQVFQVAIILVFAIFLLVYGGAKLAITQASQLSSSFNVSMFYIYAIMPVSGVVIAIWSIFQMYRIIMQK